LKREKQKEEDFFNQTKPYRWNRLILRCHGLKYFLYFIKNIRQRKIGKVKKEKKKYNNFGWFGFGANIHHQEVS